MITISPFMVDRILEIRSGLALKCFGPAHFLPTTIVTVLKINQSGKIWFFVPRWSGLAGQRAVPVQARLEFFRRGKPFQVEIDGSVDLETDENQLADLTGLQRLHFENALQSMMLVGMEINSVKYREFRKRSGINSFFECLNLTLSRIFRHPIALRNIRFRMYPV